MGLFRSGHQHDEDPDDTHEDEMPRSPAGRDSMSKKLQMRRSSGLSRNGSARSLSCSAKTIKIGTGQRTFGGNGNIMTTGVTNSKRIVSMHQSIDQFRSIYHNNDDLNLSHKSFVSDLDLESPDMAPIGEGSHENEEMKRVSGLGAQHDPMLNEMVGTISEPVSTDFTLASGSNHNCGHSRNSNTNNTRRTQNSKISLPSLVRSIDTMDDASGDLFDNLSFTSTSVMMDKERAEKVGRSGTKFVYVTLLIMGVIFTSGINLFARRAQTQRMELEFLSFARETANLAETNVNHTFSQFETLATTVTSEAMLERELIHQHYHNQDHDEETNGSWPNVTIPHFDQRIKDLSRNFGDIMLLYVPLVQEKDRESWQYYANEHAPWKTTSSNRNDALDYAPITTSVNLDLSSKDNNTDHSFGVGDDDSDHDYDHDGSDRRRRNTKEIDLSRGMSEDFKSIYPCPHHLHIDEPRLEFTDVDSILENLVGFENSQKISAPIYQYGGADHQRTEDSDIALMDLWTHPIFKKEAVASIEYNVPVISEYMDLGFLRDALSTNSSNTFNLTLPTVRSLTLQAVKEDFEPGAQTVGFVVGVVPWSTYFRNVLKTLSTVSFSNGKAREVNGIVVKVVSDCGSIFTFVLNSGDEQSEVRLEDWREQYEKYEYLEYTSRFFWKEHPKNESVHCHFNLSIYPNHEFEAMYRSNTPRYYSMVVAGIFLFTVALFACYDAFIFRGQRYIVNEATGMIIKNARRSAKNERGM